MEMASRTGLLVMNVGDTSTFRRPGYTETIPDVSFASEGMIGHVYDWKVTEDYTASDHQYITYNVRPVSHHKLLRTRIQPKWNVAKLDEG